VCLQNILSKLCAPVLIKSEIFCQKTLKNYTNFTFCFSFLGLPSPRHLRPFPRHCKILGTPVAAVVAFRLLYWSFPATGNALEGGQVDDKRDKLATSAGIRTRRTGNDGQRVDAKAHRSAEAERGVDAAGQAEITVARGSSSSDWLKRHLPRADIWKEGLWECHPYWLSGPSYQGRFYSPSPVFWEILHDQPTSAFRGIFLKIM